MTEAKDKEANPKLREKADELTGLIKPEYRAGQEANPIREKIALIYSKEQQIESILSKSIRGFTYHNGEWLIGLDCHLEIPEQRRIAKEILALFPIEEAERKGRQEMMGFKCDECSTPNFIHLVIPIKQLKAWRL